jgi:hypothetical protein
MSASIGGSLIVSVVGGVVMLAAGAVVGTAWVTGKVIQGTATIVGDTFRGRRMRLAGQQAGNRALQAHSAADDRAAHRRTDYDHQLAGLRQEQQQMLRGFQQSRRQQQDRHEESLRKIRDAQQTYTDRRCREIENDLRYVEEKFDDHITSLAKNVEARFGDERRRVDDELCRHAAQFERALENHRQDLQHQIDHLTCRVEDERSAAIDWYEAVVAEVGFIRDHFRHDFFSPGELGVIEHRLAMARQNLDQQLFASALPVAQESLLQAGLLHHKLEMLEQEWETAQVLALQNLDVALESLDAYRTFRVSAVQVQDTATDVPAASGPGEIHEVDTDYWTDGKWSTMRDKLANMRRRAAEPSATVPLEELRKFEQAGRDALAQSVVLAGQAKYAFIASVLRSDLQRDFCEKLADSGYELVDCAWMGNDQRRSNHVLLRGVNGDEIAIVLSPKPDAGTLSNTLQMHFRDPSPSEAERKDKIKALQQVLAEVYDIPTEALGMKCIPGTVWSENAADENFDLERVRRSEEG